MQKLVTFIQQLDLFGVPVKLLDNQRQKNHTTFIGGLTSCIIAIFSLIYFIYVIYLWVDIQLLPNISSAQKINSYDEFTWSTPIIEFDLQDFGSDINPFTKENNIITPLLFIIEDVSIIQKPIPLFGQTSNNSRSVFLNNGTLVFNTQNYGDDDHLKMQQYLLIFTICKNEFMTVDSYCADDETIQNYLSQYHGLFFLKVYLNQLNYASKSLDAFKKLHYTALIPNQYTYTQIVLKSQEVNLDDGILIKNTQQYKFLNNFDLINQQVDKNFITNIVYLMSNGTQQITGLYSYLIRIDNISVVQEIVMPKLGQVLAQIGSIVQIIFLLKYLALYYNETSLESELFHDIISMYYPEFKTYKNEHSIIKKFQTQDQNNLLKEKYKQYITIAQQKCRLNNILYEISRIQFILQSSLGIQALLSSHQLGGKITKYEVEENQNVKESNRLVVKPVESLELKQLQCDSVDPLELLVIQ